jgi:hypothetical protein
MVAPLLADLWGAEGEATIADALPLSTAVAASSPAGRHLVIRRTPQADDHRQNASAFRRRRGLVIP